MSDVQRVDKTRGKGRTVNGRGDRPPSLRRDCGREPMNQEHSERVAIAELEAALRVDAAAMGDSVTGFRVGIVATDFVWQWAEARMPGRMTVDQLPIAVSSLLEGRVMMLFTRPSGTQMGGVAAKGAMITWFEGPVK